MGKGLDKREEDPGEMEARVIGCKRWKGLGEEDKGISMREVGRTK